jgi:hypothetical protein
MTSPISAGLLASLTRLNESFLTESLTIIDTDASDDGAEGTTERTVIGQFWTPSAGDEAGADQIKAVGKHRAEFPKTTEVSATAQIRRANGETYNVVFIFPIGTYSTSRIVGLEDI